MVGIAPQYVRPFSLQLHALTLYLDFVRYEETAVLPLHCTCAEVLFISLGRVVHYTEVHLIALMVVPVELKSYIYMINSSFNIELD